MTGKSISFGEIQEIAQDVTRNYESIVLPSLEEVSRAFPVIGRDRVHYYKFGYLDRIPNTQEGNALRENMTFKNFSNVLDFLSQGMTVSRGCLPNHTFPVGDADDGAYMVYPYLAKKEEEKSEESTSYYWDNISSDLVDAVIRVENTGRGKILDSSGEVIENIGSNAYVDSDLTRQYLENLRDVAKMGEKYFNEIRDLPNCCNEYSQFVVEEKPEDWKEGDRFEWAHGSRADPRVVRGEVLSNYGKNLDLKVNSGTVWKGVEVPLLKDYGENGMLWKLVPGKIK